MDWLNHTSFKEDKSSSAVSIDTQRAGLARFSKAYRFNSEVAAQWSEGAYDASKFKTGVCYNHEYE